MKLEEENLRNNKFLLNLSKVFNVEEEYKLGIFDANEKPCGEIPYYPYVPITLFTDEIKIWDLSPLSAIRRYSKGDNVGCHGEAVIDYLTDDKARILPVTTISFGKTYNQTDIRSSHTIWQFYCMTGVDLRNNCTISQFYCMAGVDLRDTWRVEEPIEFQCGFEAGDWLKAFWEEVADDIDERMAAWLIIGDPEEVDDVHSCLKNFVRSITRTFPFTINDKITQRPNGSWGIVLEYKKFTSEEELTVEIEINIAQDALSTLIKNDFWKISSIFTKINNSRMESTSDPLTKKFLRTPFMFRTIDGMRDIIIGTIQRIDKKISTNFLKQPMPSSA